MDTLECIHSSKAVRCYQKRAVEDEAIAAILNAGRVAGSGKNTQLWHFILISEDDKKAALASTGDYSAHLGEAAFGIVIVTAVNPYLPAIAYFDAGRAAQNMMLAATALGIGCCPAGFRKDPEQARYLLGVPADREIVIAIAFGYPDPTRVGEESQFRRSVLDNQGRKSLASLVSENCYGNPATKFF